MVSSLSTRQGRVGRSKQNEKRKKTQLAMVLPLPGTRHRVSSPTLVGMKYKIDANRFDVVPSPSSTVVMVVWYGGGIVGGTSTIPYSFASSLFARAFCKAILLIHARGSVGVRLYQHQHLLGWEESSLGETILHAVAEQSPQATRCFAVE